MKNQNSVHVFAKWKVKEGEIGKVFGLLSIVREESRREDGNLFYKIHQSNTDSDTLILFEGYTNEAAVTAHRETAHFRELVVGQIVPLLEDREVVLTTPLNHL